MTSLSDTEAAEVTQDVIEMAEALRNQMHDGGWGLDAYAGDWRSDHPLLQLLARLASSTPEPVAWMYEREQNEVERAAVIINIGRWSDEQKRGWSETPLCAGEVL